MWLYTQSQVHALFKPPISVPHGQTDMFVSQPLRNDEQTVLCPSGEAKWAKQVIGGEGVGDPVQTRIKEITE